MAYFITDEKSTKGRDPNINIINDIHKIKGKTSVNILSLSLFILYSASLNHSFQEHFTIYMNKYIIKTV